MQAQTKVTLVPAKSLKKKPAAPAELKLVEKQLSTAHLKDVDLPEWYKHKFGAKVSWHTCSARAVVEQQQQRQQQQQRRRRQQLAAARVKVNLRRVALCTQR
jgi:hypothetical protein